MDAPFPEGMMEQIEKFLSTDTQRIEGANIYHEVFSNPLMFPLQRQAELERMIQTARSVNPTTVMEIGSDKSGGLYHWCKCLPTVQNVIACEIRGTPYDRLFEKSFHLNFFWMPGSSYNPRNVQQVELFLQLVRSKIDILFIDGDKTALEKDFLSYLPMMSRKGIVFVHDITDKVPGDAYRILCQGGSHYEIIDTSDTRRANERADAGEEPANTHEGWLRHWNGRSCGVGCIFMPEYERLVLNNYEEPS